MTPSRLLALAALGLAGCAAAPPPAAPPAAATVTEGATWMLSRLGDEAVTAPVSFTVKGERVEGVGPCNLYFGAFRRDGAALSVGPIAATRRACPDLALEERYFAALTDVTAARVEGDTLTLRDDGGAAVMMLDRAR